MNDNKTCQNWEQMYYEMQDENKKLETENVNLNDRLCETNKILMELRDDNQSLRNELLNLTGKVETFEFVFSHVKI